jgi:hypothetical protein
MDTQGKVQLPEGMILLIPLREGQPAAPSLRGQLAVFLLPVSFLAAGIVNEIHPGGSWEPATYALGALWAAQLVVQISGRIWSRFGSDGVMSFTMSFNFRRKPPMGDR